MTRTLLLALGAMSLLVACSDGDTSDNPFQRSADDEVADTAASGDSGDAAGDADAGDGEGEGGGDNGAATGDVSGPPPEEAPTIPEDLAGNVSAISYDAENERLTVTISSLDTTPVEARYNRRESLDLPGYKAFTVQEDALDRLFIAMVQESRDGSVRAAAVGDGGQFNRVFQGGFYERDGDFDPPEIGRGPGAGQVSYAGNYAGLLNGGGSGGLRDVDEGTDDALRPNQAARISGKIFLNADFADMTVNGAVYRRRVEDSGFRLRDIILIPADIDDTGRFAGDVEDPEQTAIGSYGGIFGGRDAESVGGLVKIEDFEEQFENEIEQGVFVLTKCGRNNRSGPCDQVR